MYLCAGQTSFYFVSMGEAVVPEFDPETHQLLYVAVADHLAAQMDAGILLPGARLPAERELAVQYGVAYLTVRRAMAELRDRHRIVTVHGKGTFVTSAPDDPADG